MTRSTDSAAAIAAVILIFCLASAARAAVPDSLNYQGYLTDASGAAIEGSTEMMFTIYSEPVSGAPLWSSAFLVVPVDQGLFSVQLGHVANPFPPTLFGTPLWLGVTVRGEAEMVPRRPLTTVGFAFKADDALTLTGHSAAALDQSAHVSDTDNPHRVTAPQIDAATLADIADLQAQLDAALVSIVSLQESMGAAEDAVVANSAAIAAETANRIADVDAEEAARIAAVDFESEVRANADSGHDSAIAAIQANTVLALDGILTHPDSETALFSAVNVQVVNGTGSTDGAPTGTGNIIVGYNEADSDLPICSVGPSTNSTDCAAAGGVWASSHKSGSHNVVVGDEHNYSRFGGLVVGLDNNITGEWSSVSSGFFNTASGSWSGVSGGSFNTASGSDSSVSGGEFNVASGSYSSVSGGEFNVASANDSSVSGGSSNTAGGDAASVSGGGNNTASGYYASVSGGGSNDPAFGNHAYANYSSILGGTSNETGNVAGGDPTEGEGSSISGGGNNEATGLASTVSGGIANEASGDYSSVSGGIFNTASGIDSSVTGGILNIASGDFASVTGGARNQASGESSSVSGGGSFAGGLGNHAYADNSSILGGILNVTGDPTRDRSIGAISTISGGDTNTTTGAHSTVSGGLDNTAAGFRSTVSGGANLEADQTNGYRSTGYNP